MSFLLVVMGRKVTVDSQAASPSAPTAVGQVEEDRRSITSGIAVLYGLIVLILLASGPSAVASGVMPTLRANFAGYAIRASGAGFTVSASFIVPKITCGRRFMAFAPSVVVFTSSHHRFSHSSGPSLFIGCYQGRARYFPQLVVNGHTTNYLHGSDARPGDRILLYVSESSAGTFVSAVDQTRGVTRARSGSGSGRVTFPYVADVNWVRSGVVQPVPDFRSVRFNNVQVNGKRLTAFSSLARYDMWSDGAKGGTLNVTSSKIMSGGAAFSTHFEHA